MSNKPFIYQAPFPMGKDNTEYYLLTSDYVSVADFDGETILKVEPEALTLLAQQAFHDASFMLRPAHQKQVAAILHDPEASENDKYVALQFLRNSEIAAKGVLPTCQDTGTAIIVECITDNLNRTASDVRHCFEKHGGSMGATGCVSWMFDRKGVILIEAEGLDEDEVMMDALEAGAADCALNDGVFEITTEPNDLDAVRTALEGKYTLVSAEVSMIPQNTTDPAGDDLERLQKILDMLDDLDDVSEVYHNANLPEEEEED